MNASISNIYLIGPMGAGKSSVGLQLAKLLGRDFYDSDQEIKKRTGVEISWIFAKEGEQGFRQREKLMIQELTQLDNIVLSTGGGTIIIPEACDFLRQNGKIVYLKVSLAEQQKRTAFDRGHRPLIEEADDRHQALANLNQVREPIYQQLADLTYITDKLEPKVVAKKIINDLNRN